MSESATLSLGRLSNEKMASSLHIREHSFKVDVNAAAGGEDLGPDPHDLYDAALGACKSLTMMWLARRKGYDVRDIAVRVSRDASLERQGSYTLTVHVEVKGNLNAEAMAALAAAAEKCPIQKLMTQATTVVNTEVRLLG